MRNNGRACGKNFSRHLKTLFPVGSRRFLIVINACSLLIFILVILSVFSVQTFRVYDHSMEPALTEGSLVFVSKIYRPFNRIKTGDLIVFIDDNNEAVIKRCFLSEYNRVALKKNFLVNLKGETVELSTVQLAYYTGLKTIPPGYFFLLGDNRSVSRDSRDYGLVGRERIIGKVFFIFNPS
jgi:signal peptidase I